MPRRCKTCDHEEQEAIDRALIRNEISLPLIAERFGLKRTSLWRHRRNHLGLLVAKGLAATAEQAADEKPADETPTDTKPADEKREAAKPADDKPADQEPVDEIPAATSRAISAAREQQAVDAAEVQIAIDVVAQLRAINAACLEVLKTARASGNHSTLLRAVDRIHRQIEFQARLLGDVQDSKLQVAIGAGAQVVVLIPDNNRGDASPHRSEAGLIPVEVSAYLGDGEDEDGP